MATLVPIRSTEGGADRSLWRPSMTIVVSDAEIWTGIPRVLGCVRCAFCRGSSCCETVKSCHTPKMLRGLERTLRQTHGLARTLQQTHGELQRHCPQWHTRHTSTHAPSSIQYGAPENRDLQPVLELLQHAFTTREPITEGLRIEKKDFESWAPRCVEEMFEQNVSLVARDTSKDLLVGFQLTEIETPDSTTGLRGAAMRCNNPAFQKLFRLLSDLDDLAEPYSRFEVDKLFRLQMIAVRDDYLSQGIGKELFKRSVDGIFPTSGCKVAVSECTGIRSQKMFRQGGFHAVAHIDYSEYTVNGETVLDLTKLGPHSCAIFFARELA